MGLTGREVMQKPMKAKRNPDHMARVAALPCVVCFEWSLPQQTPTQVHHVIHGRYGTRRAPDEMTIPLCRAHHMTGEGGYVALHREPAKWKRLYGEDVNFISWVEERIA